MADLQLTNGKFVKTADGDLALIDNESLTMQEVRHELATEEDEIDLHPGYGTPLLQFLHMEQSELAENAIANVITETVKKYDVDENSIHVTITRWGLDGIHGRVSFRPLSARERVQTQPTVVNFSVTYQGVVLLD
ncbi:hypothetical protein [Brevibacillus thermoruber]|uniref:hypothetical protein n=1 Tax=Brevibacillus thermoruber TaxID=33942 RepID=UPI000556DDD0|nr:hypothetical protein [Brevibacillus thermoruber]